MSLVWTPTQVPLETGLPRGFLILHLGRQRGGNTNNHYI